MANIFAPPAGTTTDTLPPVTATKLAEVVVSPVAPSVVVFASRQTSNGVAVAVAVGVAVGVVVGVSLGVAVGVSVGVTVGVSVGVAVGVSVGVLVGVSVGVGTNSAVTSVTVASFGAAVLGSSLPPVGYP